MIFAFRVDASIEIGTGHVMRCLTLADALNANGDQCYFLTRRLPGHMIDTIENRNHKVIALPAPRSETSKQNDLYGSWLGVSRQQDADQCFHIFHELAPDFVVVDHYALDKEWEAEAIPETSAVLVIDDLANRPHRCDILLDQNLGRKFGDYDGLVPQTATRLIGPKYALLRPEFANMRSASLNRRVKPELRHILISMGGVDKDNASGKVLEALARLSFTPDLNITVVLGGAAPNRKVVEKQAETMPITTRVLTNVTDMAQLMASADLVVGAAGSSSWERCCLGLPSITLALADNQLSIAEEMDKQKMSIFIGTVDDHFLQSKITTNFPSIEELKDMSMVSRDVTDGLGVRRVRLAIVRQMTLSSLPKGISKDFILRVASVEDAGFVFYCRYKDSAEQFYLSAQKPDISTHVNWFSQALVTPDRLLLIGEFNGDRAVHVRCDLSYLMDGRIEGKLSIYTNPEKRGQGIGSRMLEGLLVELENNGVNKCVAEVHQDNMASISLFRRFGFRETGYIDTQFIYFTRYRDDSHG